MLGWYDFVVIVVFCLESEKGSWVMVLCCYDLNRSVCVLKLLGKAFECSSFFVMFLIFL